MMKVETKKQNKNALNNTYKESDEKIQSLE